MKKKIAKDRVLAIIMILIALFFIWQASIMPSSAVNRDPGPKLFPYIGSGIMIVCSLILLIKPSDGGKGLRLDGPARKRLVVILGIYIIYVLGSVFFGVLYVTPIILFIVSYLFSKSSRPDMPKGKRIIQTLIYTVIVCAALYAIYVIVLDTQFKTGSLFRLLFK